MANIWLVLPVLLVSMHGAATVVAGPLVSRDSSNDLMEQIVGSRDKKVKEVSWFQEAWKAFRKRDIKTCLSILETACKQNDRLPPERLMLARFYLVTRQIPQARLVLEQVASNESNYAGVYLTFAKLGLAEGRLTDAMLHLERAQQLAPTSEQRGGYIRCAVHDGLATIAERRRQWEVVEKHLQAWLKYQPTNVTARDRLAQSLVARGKNEEALAELKKAIESNPDLPSAALGMARLWEWMEKQSDDAQTRLKSCDKSEEWFRVAVVEASDHPMSHREFAGWLLEHHRPVEAAEHARHAADLAPESRVVLLLQAQIARAQKRAAAAVKLLEQLHKRNPADVETSNLLAMALTELDDEQQWRRALQLAQVNARQFPRSSRALATLGWAQFKLGRQKEAAQLLARALAIGPATSDIAYFYSRSAQDSLKSDQLVSLLQRATKTVGVFVYRPEAIQLLEAIEKKAAKAD